MNSYLALLRDVMENGERHEDRTGVGTRSVFGRQFRHDMRTGFPLLTTKKVAIRWVFEELRWFLSGSTNEQDLSKTGVDIWAEWATAEKCAKFGRQAGDLGPVYGHLWRNFGGTLDETGFGVDQINQLLDDINKTPNSRRLIVSGWHPEEAKQVELPPCHSLFQLRCHFDGTMSLHMYMRSCDIFLGLPFNIASYAMLLEMLCFVTGNTPRELIISFGDLHLYNNHVDQANMQLEREPYELPSVVIDAEVKSTMLDTLLGITWLDVIVDGYKSHPKIEAPVAV